MTSSAKNRRQVAILLVVAVLWPVAAWTSADPPWQWDDVPKVVAFGDVHGAYDRLVEILTQTGVVDAQLNWAGGKTHLVSLGDLLDRGPDSRKVLDLLMRLEREAPGAGGRVHLVLGNHEVMNLIGDLRYASDEEYAAFANDEVPADREMAWERYQTGQGAENGTEELRAQFDQAYPPGFFGLRAAFSPDGLYGSWLLGKGVLVRLDGTAFVHGGLSRLVGRSDGAAINRWAMVQLREYMAIVDGLEKLGVLGPEIGYAARIEAVTRAIDAQKHEVTPRSAAKRSSDAEVRDLGQRLIELTERALVFSSNGPLWYRGTATGETGTEQSVLEHALATLGAERVAIGHTPTPDRHILPRLEGRAILIDTGMLEQVYEGRATALIQEGPRIVEFDPAEHLTRELHTASGVPQAAEAPASTPTDLELEGFLLTATAISAETIGFGATDSFRVTLEKDGIRRHAVFSTATTSGREVAAYRMDRLLGLEMVPVAVRRTIREREGTLRFWVEDSIGDEERGALGLGLNYQDSIDRQMQNGYVFDALIYNDDRPADSIRLTPADWRVRLTDHIRAFQTKTGLPSALRTVELSPAPELAAAVAEFDEVSLRAAMDGLLERAQVNSILKRRTKLVAAWTKLGLLQEAAVGAGR